MDVLDSILHLIGGVIFMADALSCSTPWHAVILCSMETSTVAGAEANVPLVCEILTS